MSFRSTSPCHPAISLCLAFLAAAPPAPAADADAARVTAWAPATPEKLPRWRGFNLLEKFHRDRGNEPFRESDFSMIADFGFNVVRLPMDYRCWIVDDDWEQFHEPTLRDIDEAVDFGRRYGIHVMLNFHRAPGYCVNKRPPEPTSLWQDVETQRVCALHWATFARRYRGIPNERLSFNLVNEPNGVDAVTYLGVVETLAAAIRAEDPERLIVSDSFFGSSAELASGLKRLRVAFSSHQYWPGQVSHYQASWVTGADRYPAPAWPMLVANGTLYAATKPDVPTGPLVVTGPFTQSTAVRIRIHQVSARASLVLKADGETVWTREFVPGPGAGEWRSVIFAEPWQIYQNIYDLDCTAVIPAATAAVTLECAAGDWAKIGELGFTPAGASVEHCLTLAAAWGEAPAAVRYDPAAAGPVFSGDRVVDIDAMRTGAFANWRAVEAAGIGVFVGEFGAFNRTPHPVTLAWMEDSLRLMHEFGWGWALWNLRGGFGILDSGRADVEYEEYRGHKLDRKMLELLQRY